MKNRSHRPPMSEPRHDDWVDGSWTVDCICGVNFDDGEEMVDCDECGVWVHTRCSRYVKGERSFSCDKCRSKKSVGRGSCGHRNDTEETEVAEFLVELPTKAMLGAPNPVGVSSRRSSRLWTDIPMEERVHVQGVPGGDSGLFSRSKMSSIIGPQLWKSSGYVPKKFNFRCPEFSWLDRGEMIESKSEKNGDLANSDSGALFSLSKDDAIGLMTVRNSVDAALSTEISSPTQEKKLDDEKLDPSCHGNKETTSLPITSNSSKRKLEQNIMLNDREQKKSRTAGKEGGEMDDNQAIHSKADSCDVKPLLSSQQQEGCLEVPGLDLGECTTNLALKEQTPDPLLGVGVSCHDVWRAERKGSELTLRRESSSKCNTEKDGGSAGNIGKEALVGYSTDEVTDSGKNEDDQSQEHGMATEQHNKKPKSEVFDGADERNRTESLPNKDISLDSMKATTQPPDHRGSIWSELVKVSEKLMSPSSIDSKLRDASDCLTIDESGNANTHKPQADAGPKMEPALSELSLRARKELLKYRHSSKVPDEMTYKRNSAASYEHKVIGASVKSVSSSGSKALKVSDNHEAMDSHRRQKESLECNAGAGKEDALADTVDAKSVRAKNFVKELSGFNSGPEMLDSAEISNLSSCNITYSNEKDFKVSSCFTLPQTGKVPSVSVSPEGGRQLPAGVRPIVKSRAAATSASSKGEKSRLLDSQTSSRGNMVFPPASSSAPAALSDEELALLLHQELNSSPRVPRVPRMRNAGSIVQLACSKTTSMPMKRTSSRGKESVSYKRRSKEVSSDGSDGYFVTNHEAKKTERKPSSSDDSRQDSACSAFQQKESDCGSTKNVQSLKKTCVSSCLSSDAYEHDLASKNPSARNASEGGPHKVGSQAHRTLPGVIAEIMNEGKHMTYEELCNAVLPHWPHLRKHNGERYAYSSHSQAVLDCLRNRSEWARLVDRGPKTNASRKRRKNDADSLSVESDDAAAGGMEPPPPPPPPPSSSHPEEGIPKGKRKARKRKWVAAAAAQEEGKKRRRSRRGGEEEEDIDEESESSSSSYSGSGCSSEDDDEEDDDVSSAEERGDDASTGSEEKSNTC